MQATHDEGHESSRPAQTAETEGLLQDPHRVTRLLINGWDTEAGETKEFKFSNETAEWAVATTTGERQCMEFVRIHIPFLRLYDNAHMLFIQGMGVSQIFLASELELPGGLKFKGPFIYVCGAIREMWRVPFGIDDLVLAKLVSVPGNKMTLEQANVLLFNWEFMHRKK